MIQPTDAPQKDRPCPPQDAAYRRRQASVYQNVCVEALAYTLPEEVVTSEQIEQHLQPLYRRLKLPEGRLELMSGIRERRLWPRGMRPGDKSLESGQRVIRAAGIDPSEIGCLIHGSVCRDQLEPATACSVHHGLDLPADCLVYDVSNACLGLLSGMIQVANMIELGQIRAGLVVGTEDSRALLESTIAALNADESLTRDSVKPAFASLTIGSASAAILLVHKEISRTANHLTAAVARAHTAHHALCQGGHAESSAVAGRTGASVLMQTDSEQLLAEGLATGAATFEQFLAAGGFARSDLHKTVCHQVGGTHRKLMLQSLGLSPDGDYITYPWLGNTGSVALPVTLARAVESGFVEADDRVALLGIGSGINCLMLAVEWQTTLHEGRPLRVLKPGQRRAAAAGPHVMAG